MNDEGEGLSLQCHNGTCTENRPGQVKFRQRFGTWLCDPCFATWCREEDQALADAQGRPGVNDALDRHLSEDRGISASALREAMRHAHDAGEPA